MGYSSDHIPRVGPIPCRPGMFIMGGFTGHGMPQVSLRKGTGRHRASQRKI
jgi:hypothetical protein